MQSRHIEELTLNAWPPLEIMLVDGWLLSFSNGYTRRVNSVHPLYASTEPMVQKIETSEALYAARGRPTIFKLTSSPDDAELDRTLHARGYTREAPTSVQTVDLARPGGDHGGDQWGDADQVVTLESTLSERWFEDFNRLTLTSPELHVSERRLLEKIGPPHRFASIARDGATVALGLGVAERGYVGLFDIVVDARVRHQGLGRRLCSALLGWARASQSAHTGYLAVMQDNTPALHLYAQLGFQEVFTYWYRSRQLESSQ